jgi:antirestriction protein ArdC
MRAAATSPTQPPSIAARVTAQIRDALNRGVRPWVQPFLNTPPPLPRRATGEPYRGSNILTLWAASAAAGFISPHWFTLKQANALNAHIRRGERGTFIVFYAPRADTPRTVPPASASDKDPSSNSAHDATPTRGAILRGYTVFNADQIDGLPDTFLAPATHTPAAEHGEDDTDNAALATAFARVPATLRPANTAFYRPSTDTVHIPPRHAFVDTPRFFATRAHELAHWTRSPTRLNRDFPSTRYGDAGYALEELTAELAAAFLGAQLNLPVDHLEDHSAYIASWLKVLTHDPSAFLTAAAHAQRAADFLNTFLNPAAPAPTP